MISPTFQLLIDTISPPTTRLESDLRPSYGEVYHNCIVSVTGNFPVFIMKKQLYYIKKTGNTQ